MNEQEKRARLSALLEQKAAAAAGPQPLAVAQERLWFLEQLEPGTPLYAIPLTVRLRGALDTGALERALNEIVRRQAVLRTTFGADDGGRPYQTVNEFQPFTLPVADLRTLPAAEREAEARRLAAAEGRRPFDLQCGPLARFQLFRLADDEHWLQLALHHIIADGWSIGVIFQELAALYGAFTTGAALPLPVLPLSYAAFARRQREQHAGGALAADLAYWTRQLGGRLPVLQLPTDRPRPAVISYQGAFLCTRVPAALANAFKAFCRREGVTPFMALLAAFSVLMYRYSRQDDLVIGTPVAGRSSADVEGLVGLFVNTLPLRADLSGRPAFRELLRRVREVSLDGFSHAEVPFAQLVEVLHPERQLGSSPLFQVMFSLENAPMGLRIPGLEVQAVEVHSGTAKFDLSLFVGEEHGDWKCQWEFKTELFDAESIRRMGAQFETLLAAILADPDQPVDTLNILPDAERSLVVETFNQTAAAYPLERCIHQLVAERAAELPDRVAVVCGDGRLTYAELDRQANRLARHLQGLGVGREALVGIALDRSTDLAVAMLAVLKAGGAYVPMDPGYPRDRLAYMLEDTGLKVVLTRNPAALPTVDGVQYVAPDAAFGESDAPVFTSVTPDNLAYVIFTSGSTGKPKGVQVCHRGLTNVVTWIAGQHNFSPADAMLAETSVSFDIAQLEFYLPLMSGGKLVIATRADAADGAKLAALMAAHGANYMQGTPATYRLLLAAGWQSRPGLTLFVGGEALPRELADRILAGGGTLWNYYGPTETTVWSAAWRVAPGVPVSIGRPGANTQIYLLDGHLNPVPVGVPGELYIGGDGLARGYLNRPDLTAERFVSTERGRLYRTGDLARFRPNGEIEFLGRLDNQVKIRGYRIELGEIEAVLEQHPAVAQAVVKAWADGSGEQSLLAYYVPKSGAPVTVGELRSHLKGQLPEFMVPSRFIALEQMPLTGSGKVDRKALPEPDATGERRETAYVPPATDSERKVTAIWQEVLRVEHVGLDDNFFDLGGHSLLAVRLLVKLNEAFPKADLQLMDLFKYTTVRLQAERIRGQSQATTAAGAVATPVAASAAVAIIGMAGRFPGAPDIETFWQNLREGKLSIHRFTREELEAAGADPDLLDDPTFVPCKGYLEGADLFDAGFFAVTPRDAQAMDPQQRLFLEVAHTALEHGGYDPQQCAGRIGVFAGAAFPSYLLNNLTQNPAFVDAVGLYQLFVMNDKDFITTRTAYKLGLKGPAVTVQTACSTSLVAVHMACRSLLSGDCDMALAGGASVTTPLVEGYRYEPGHISSPDGHCRAFDAEAAGTVAGNGVGAVLLKRLDDAIRDGDLIHAVIKATAINNDGGVKMSFMAPSIDGQAGVIAKAMADAGVSPDSITYVEAHGTGTLLGDPIEIAGLTQAYRAAGGTVTPHTCAVGSVKTNLGHLDTAAGVAGLIKTALALEHREIPPSLGFAAPNPKIDFAAGPFYVAAELQPWTAPVRRAGVSAFGIGGTNVHAILEEAPPAEPSGPSRPAQLLPLSARSEAALNAATANLGKWLQANPGANLADVAYTLQVGRRALPHRRMLVARDASDAAAALQRLDPERVLSAREQGGGAIAFLFAGQGPQYVGMARELYEHEPVFRAEVDRCCELLKPELNGLDLRTVLYPTSTHDAEVLLNQTRLTQPALFVIQYAMARLFMAWGIQPTALLGHSLGEYAAACLAGVFSLEDGLRLVAARGRLMESATGGAMLAVALSEAAVTPLLPPNVGVAAVNGPAAVVVSGPEADVVALQARLEAQGIDCRRPHIVVAGHSAMMEPIMGALAAVARSMRLNPPTIPVISNVTGTWLTLADATDPEYWARHLRRPVRFAEGLAELFAEPSRILLEVGPGQTVATLARRHPARGAGRLVLNAGRHPKDPESDTAVLLGALGRLWLAGVPMAWAAVNAGQRRHRIPLPTYPFERQRYWVEPVIFEKRVVTADVTAEVAATVEVAETPAADLTPVEAAVVSIWQEVLGIAVITVNDNFFELGGDSLVAARVLLRLRETFPVIEVPLRALFEAPTVARLAALIEQLLIEKLESMSDDDAAQLQEGGVPHA